MCARATLRKLLAMTQIENSRCLKLSRSWLYFRIHKNAHAYSYVIIARYNIETWIAIDPGLSCLEDDGGGR